MAVKQGFGQWIAPRVHKQTWDTLANGDTGTSLSAAWLADKSVQIKGTFGAGGTCDIEGSNDGGTTWKVLTDFQGNNVRFTSAGIEQIAENTELIRPNVTGGDGTTALTVIIVSQGTKG